MEGQQNEDIIEHTVVIDSTISFNLKIPKILTASAFRGMISKINSIIKYTGFDVSYPGAEQDKAVGTEMPIPKRGMTTYYTEEEKAFLRDLVTKGYGKSTLTKMLKDKFGKDINKYTMKNHMEKNFEVKPRMVKGVYRDEATNETPKETVRKDSLPAGVIEYILTEYHIKKAGAGDIIKGIKEKFNMDVTHRQVYYISFYYKKTNKAEYQKVIKENEVNKNEQSVETN
jgi:hypothetical protein